MARFQIFIPTEDTAQLNTEKLLTDVGLADLIEGAAPERSHGPEEQKGVVISWPTVGDSHTGYKPEQQKWIHAKPKGNLEAKRYWVGIWNDNPPTPNDLKRNYQYRGGFVAMNDGQEWLMPMAGELPTDAILADDGTWKFVVQRQFHDLFNEATRWHGLVTNSDGGATAEYSDIIEFVVPALSLNYFLTPEVVSELRLLSKEVSVKCLHTICGL